MKFIVKGKGSNRRLVAEGRWPTTRKGAIRASVKKWETIVQWIEAHPRLWRLADGRADTCALCRYFGACRRCPVMEVADAAQCTFTPYMDYYNAPRRAEALRAARDEVAFLKSLLAKEA